MRVENLGQYLQGRTSQEPATKHSIIEDNRKNTEIKSGKDISWTNSKDVPEEIS